MWILPSKLKTSFLSAQGLEDSKGDLNELASQFEPSVMWKQKHLSSRTWSQQWKRVYWLKPLFGQTLEHSKDSLFVDWYTASQVGTHAHHSLMPVREKERKIQDTFSRIYSMLPDKFNLFGASLRTSQDTSHWDMTKFTEAYQILVTQLIAEYSQRERLALHNLGKDSSFSQSEKILYPTPSTQEIEHPNMQISEDGRRVFLDKSDTRSIGLADRVRMDPKAKKKNFTGLLEGIQFHEEVGAKSWVTPTSRDYKGANSIEHLTRESDNPNHVNQLANQVIHNGLLHQEDHSGTGRNREQLNPAWSIQLMGTTLKKTFFVPLATQWLSKPQN